MSISLDTLNLINQLDESGKLEFLKRQIGYKCTPVSIRTFVEDPYYLGKEFGINPLTGKLRLFKCWMDRLEEVFPNSITTTTYLVVNGAIGTGKSTFSKIILLYDVYKWLCCTNPSDYMELAARDVKIKIFNTKKWKANDMVNEIYDIINKSQFFQNEYNKPDSLIHHISFEPAASTNDILSGDVLSVMLSEYNFIKYMEVAKEILDSCISRIESRYQKGFNLFNHVILDSSNTIIESPVNEFIKKDPHARLAKIFSTSIWEAKPDLYFKTGSFKCYAGDSKHKPHIIAEGENTSELDQDRIVICPNELRANFESNVELALQEKAGVSIESTDKFMSYQRIAEVVKLPMDYSQEITIDFGTKTDSYINYLAPYIEDLPKDRCIFGRLDLGISHDKAGFAIGYIENTCMRDFDGVSRLDPEMRVPIATRFSRYDGEETDIDQLVDLILYIHSRRPFYSFTTDTYQSFQIQQQLRKANINSFMLSVDRTDIPYVNFKNAIYRHKVLLPNNEILINELKSLLRVGYKIDHPQTLNAAGEIGSNSKDTADAVCGVVSEMMNAPAEAMDVPITSNTEVNESYNNLLDQLIDRQNKKRIIYSNGWY